MGQLNNSILKVLGWFRKAQMEKNLTKDSVNAGINLFGVIMVCGKIRKNEQKINRKDEQT
jgi:hypothetical protein